MKNCIYDIHFTENELSEHVTLRIQLTVFIIDNKIQFSSKNQNFGTHVSSTMA